MFLRNKSLKINFDIDAIYTIFYCFYCSNNGFHENCSLNKNCGIS